MNREWFARYHEQIDPWIRMRGEERELFGFFFEWCASDEPEMVPHLIGELVGFSRDRALSIFDTSLKYRISWFLELHPDAEARMGKLGWLAP